MSPDLGRSTGILPVLLIVAASLTCSSPKSDEPKEKSTPDGSVIESDVQTGWGVCTPGEGKVCSDDKKGRVRCADDGSGWVSEKCTDDKGQQSLCYEAECLKCMPLNKRCRDDDTVEICNDDGSAWEVGQSCNGAVTGQVCETGSCIALCENMAPRTALMPLLCRSIRQH